MRGRLGTRKTAASLAAVFLSGALLVWVLLPPRQRATTGAPTGTWAGAFHVHTDVSDGGGTRDDVARAAAAAGLQFVILTDHGDGTRAPAAPEYVHGVLVIEGVEITTWDGHYAAFGQRVAPYPLGGPATAVVQDVERLGGFGVIAHPRSAKSELAWRADVARLPVSAIEILNGDSAWRDESAWSLVRTFASYPFRPAESLAALIDRPVDELRLLEAANRMRRTPVMAGADAHGRLPLSYDDTDGGAEGASLSLPSYEQAFRAATNTVDVGSEPTGNAADDAGALMRAMRLGRITAAVSGLASPAAMEFTATSDAGAVAGMGARVGPDAMTFAVQVPDVRRGDRSEVRLRLYNGDVLVAEAEGPTLSHRVEAIEAAGVWHAEASLAPSVDRPWLIGSPIVVVSPAWEMPGFGARRFAEAAVELIDGPWAIEKHDVSEGAIVRDEAGLRFDYALADGPPSGQYAAVARSAAGTGDWTHVVIRGFAPEPTRLWVQLRLENAAEGQRWGRSIYFDRHSSELTLALDEFQPLEPALSAERAEGPTGVTAILLVVDTVNSAPGRRGSVTIEQVALERR